MWDGLSKELLYNVKTYKDTTFSCVYCFEAYFNSQWWYMPDASWNGSTDDFGPHEWKLINDYK